MVTLGNIASRLEIPQHLRLRRPWVANCPIRRQRLGVGQAFRCFLPFKNMSGDPEQEYFVDGLVEDIIARVFNVIQTRVGS